jgi:hypothetical protein
LWWFSSSRFHVVREHPVSFFSVGTHVYLTLLGLFPIIGELKCCGNILDGAESTDHIGQLASEQKCIDAVIHGMGALYSTLFTDCYSGMSSRSLGHLRNHVDAVFVGVEHASNIQGIIIL